MQAQPTPAPPLAAQPSGRPAASAPPPAAADHDWSTFKVEHPRERLELLDLLRERSVPVVISSPDGTSISTSLWGVDEAAQRLNFSAQDDSHQLDTLVESDEAVAVAYLERVKLQFDLHDLLLVRGASVSALQCRVPDEIFRFQRRQAFRVQPALRHTPGARLRHPSLPDMQLDLRVVDVSLGGCALWLPADVPPLQPGAVLANVRIELDAQTQFGVELTLRHVASMGCTDGPERGVRLGCSWRPVSPAALRNLQRWIDQAQKRTRLLAAAATRP
jgi:c-di-GMP-binding flagellar brake protein YcgR